MISSQSYLINVVKEWRQFCNSHKNFANAINDILSENNSLKNQVSFLKYRVNELEKQLKGGVNNG